MADEFPQWSRLHVYWRTIPYFNQYCDAKDDTEDSDHVQVVIDVPVRMATRKRKPSSTVKTVKTVITPIRSHVNEATLLYTSLLM